MGKYEPLTAFLKGAGSRQLRMSFAEVEKVLGFQLPASKQYPAWWSNNPSNNVMTKAWLAAGFKTEQVDTDGEKVTFVSDRSIPSPTAPGAPPQLPKGAPPLHHPAWGAWKGLVTLLPGYDYTQPADPEWSKVYDE
jgi:hypothetical protein